MDLQKVQEAINKNSYEWKKHVLVRIAQRNIKQTTVIKSILNGEIIEDYPEDRLFPSCLMLYFIDKKPIHVVLSYDETNRKVYVITVYEPTLEEFCPDFKTRRKK